ncbi:pilus assembly protein [Massilia sp. YIM B02763]|uniref:TadE/TadG family type IV pilus assembly protein n=1 Tax=Massilia sp. YIM B02763 TaxID=3050130 RepID=UPI0025B68F6E|nr:TadE family protein [Massilia sp. YIM B02763]MDN4051990.1 pilus assembly protein [Massilia sp. YIM B02763]
MSPAWRKRAPRARGSVAVELALLLLMFATMLYALLFFGWIFWHYTVATKAAHDAARFLAAATPREIQGSAGGAEVPIVAVARRIAALEVGELSPGGGVSTGIFCYVGDSGGYWNGCFGFDRPKKVMVRVTVYMRDPFFDMMIVKFTNSTPVDLRTAAVMEYAGG